MKARTFILTTSAIVALVAPAAHAASTSNRLYQTQKQTVQYEKTHQTVAKSHAKKVTTTKGTKGKKVAVRVHNPRRPAPPVAAIISSAATSLLDGTYDSPNECIETSTGTVSGGSDPIADPPAVVAAGGNDGSADTPPAGDPPPADDQQGSSNGQGLL